MFIKNIHLNTFELTFLRGETGRKSVNFFKTCTLSVNVGDFKSFFYQRTV